jgi:dienelactone hydrolase
MFKPEGDGPFPALVLMPTCFGQVYSLNTFDWAERALAHGYAALVVDPLSERKSENNCPPPLPIPAGRLLKDAFDAAAHLRRQPFIDPQRIALMGFSQGGMVALGAASGAEANTPFRAIVAVYPVCVHPEVSIPGKDSPVDLVYVPQTIAVPTFVEMGDGDTQGGPPMNGCPPLLDARKTQGAPVDYVVYHATHLWDHRELGKTAERITGRLGQEVLYRYSPEVTEQSATDAFTFLDRVMKSP